MAKPSGKDQTFDRTLKVSLDQVVYSTLSKQTLINLVQFKPIQTVSAVTCLTLLIGGGLPQASIAQLVARQSGAEQSSRPSLKQLLSESASPNLVASSQGVSANAAIENELPLALAVGPASAVSSLAAAAAVQANQLSNQPITPTIQFTLPSPGETVAQATEGTTSSAEFSPRVEARYNTEGAGYRDYFGLGGFVPVFQTPGKDLTYVQGRLLLQPNNTTLGGNVLVGYRLFDRQENRVYGGYVAYDNRDTGRSFFNQLGFGLEALSDDFDARLNAYFPVGTTRNQIASTSGTSGISFSGNNLLLNTSTFRQFESAATAVDLEVGRSFLQLGETTLRGYAGAYYLNAQGSPDVVGVRGRVEATASDVFRLSLGIQNDGLFDTRLVLGVGVNFPGSTPGSKGRITTVLDRMGESPFRENAVTVADATRTGQTESSTRSEVAINSRTGQPYRFLHVVSGQAGNGTAESPLGSITQALAVAANNTDVIYVRGSGVENVAALTVPAGIDLLFNRIQQLTPDPVTNANNQRVTLPLFDPNARYTVNVTQLNLTGSNTVVSGVTVGQTVTVAGNNTVLDNVAITAPNGPAVQASNVSGLTVQNSTLTSQNGRPIDLNNVTGTVTITGNTLNVGGATNTGVAITNTQGTTDLTVANNVVNGATNNGVTLALSGTATGTFRINNNTIAGTSFVGIRVTDTRTTTTPATVEISNNQVRNNGDLGIFVSADNNAQLRLTMDGNTVGPNNATGGAYILAQGNSSIFTRVRLNTFTGNAGAAGDFTLQNAGTGQFCAVLANNTIGSFNRLATSPIQIEGGQTGTGNNITSTPTTIGTISAVPTGTCGF